MSEESQNQTIKFYMTQAQVHGKIHRKPKNLYNDILKHRGKRTHMKMWKFTLANGDIKYVPASPDGMPTPLIYGDGPPIELIAPPDFDLKPGPDIIEKRKAQENRFFKKHVW